MSTTKRMLINATQQEEVRVAIVNGSRIEDLDIEHQNSGKKAWIIKGKVKRVESSLDAVFVDINFNKHGFLPIKEISREYFNKNQDAATEGRPSVKDLISPNQELIVQVEKDERGTKGAALTTFISLAGCYLVLMPNNPRAGGISRRIEGEERQELKDALSQLQIPHGMGVIVRTAGVGRSAAELQWDLDVLLSQWQAIQTAANSQAAPFLIYKENDVIVRAIRDHLKPDIDEIFIDTETAYEHAIKHVQMMRPDFVNKIKLYKDPIPLFNRYQIEQQIETAFKREVPLENGASIVIDHSEALIAIDINSAKATKGGDIEETALATNLAAAKEIARQLRLRDIGGLIVIDFIDMLSNRNQRQVENQLREELKADRARVQIGRISRFGLLEMSRQRLGTSLGDTSHIPCPRCAGHGSIRNTQSTALAILRVLEDEAIREHTNQINVQAPIDVATFLVNEKRDRLEKLEKRHETKIIIIPNKYLESPNYEIERVKGDLEQIKSMPSYKMVSKPEKQTYKVAHDSTQQAHHETPAITSIAPKQPAPVRDSATSILKRIWHKVFGELTKEKEDPKKSSNQNRHPKHKDQRSRNKHGKPHHKGGQRKHRDQRDRDHRDNRENREPRDNREHRENKPRHPKHGKHKSQKYSRDTRDNRDNRDNRNLQHNKEQPQVSQQPAEINSVKAAPVQQAVTQPPKVVEPAPAPAVVENKKPQIAEPSAEQLKARNQISFFDVSQEQSQTAQVAAKPKASEQEAPKAAMHQVGTSKEKAQTAPKQQEHQAPEVGHREKALMAHTQKTQEKPEAKPQVIAENAEGSEQ